MQFQRVVQVQAAGFGSGYLIAPRLVLTAAHLLARDGAAPGQVAVSLPGTDADCPAAVRWWRYDAAGPVDAALLEIPAGSPRWTVPGPLRGDFGRRPQRWGWCVTGGGEVPVTAAGFPRQQRARGGDWEKLVGRVRPHGGATFEILDDAGVLGIDGDGTAGSRATPWSGMSGAAVFAAGQPLLLGVVRADRRPRHGTRLTYTRSADLIACEGFRTAVRAATGTEPLLEPAELADLLEPAPPKRELTSPTTLLRADAEVVSFHGRQDTLADLERWCLADHGAVPSLRVVTAPGGQGKTRLARQLMSRLRGRGWVVGQVRGEPADLRLLRTVQHPLLLVVDYAESRPDVVRKLLEQAAEVWHPVRLLLLARSLGSWQDRVPGAVREVRLHALSPEVADRAEAFERAVADFSRRLAETADPAGPDWRAAAAALADAPPGRLASEHPGRQTALTVQMSALAALLRQARPAQDPAAAPPEEEDQGTLEAELIGHERRYWLEVADERGMSRREKDLLAQAAATAVLCPAQDADEARATVGRLLPHAPHGTVAALTAWLRDLYPSSEGSHWGRLEPDRLAEYHASEQVVRDDGLLTRLFSRAPDHQRAQILTVLARAAVAHANEGRPGAASTVVDRLRQTLRATPDDAPLTAAMLRAHAHTLPEQSHVLRGYALDVARKLSELSRPDSLADLADLDDLERTATDDPRTLGEHASDLHQLAERHLATGDLAAAGEAADAAAALRERLAAATGAPAHRAGWADSLLLLSRTLRQTGDLPRAHRAGTRALALFRALTEEGGGEEDTAERESGLVRALVDQSYVVWQLDPTTTDFDQVARSDDHTAEAVRRARALAWRLPDPDPHLLPMALVARSANLWRLQRNTDAPALALSEEAVRTFREAARENPDAYSGDLAQALMGLAVDYAAAGRPPEGSMALEREAIALLGPLAADVPAHRSTLAQVLHNLAWNQFYEGDRAAARASVMAAIGHRQALARDGHGSAGLRLADSLRMLAFLHEDERDHWTAVELGEEAAAGYAQAALPLSASDLHNQSVLALQLARSYDALGRPADALAAHDQALAIRRTLSRYAPSLYTYEYASALHDLSDLYRKHDRQVAVRIVLRQALPAYRRLARTDRQARRQLAYCLYDLGSSYLTTQATQSRAVPALREAYGLWARLAADDPGAERQLADAGTELGRALMLTSRFGEAVQVAAHEVGLRRKLAGADRSAHELLLCYGLLRLAEGQAMTGRDAAAWTTALEAEEACHTLAGRGELTPRRTAALLGSLAGALSRCGAHDVRRAARAVAPARLAVRGYRLLVDRDPHDTDAQAGLNRSLRRLTEVLHRVGRYDDALDVQRRRAEEWMRP
ncbi:hypothetical protein [Actinacidiphila sp. bgisy145]|uniref:hypothetical protein n=1 Tax=Actinacidiphila sp. bgisy145 TaxID=3413792 RepID=UPI003EB84F9F